MRILSLEFASSGLMEGTGRGILSEGFSMLKLVSEGLDRAGHEVFAMVGKRARSMGRLDAGIVPQGDVVDTAARLDVDYVFPIAPDAELAEMVGDLSRKGIRCVSSDVGAIRMASDKLETCRRLEKKDIDTPMFGEGAGFPLVEKSRYGVACDGLRLVREEDTPSGNETVRQEFIRGEDASVTLFSDGETAVPVSLNRQEIEFRRGEGTYLGGEVPFEHPLGEGALEAARRAVESIPGLRGCIGVDLVLAEKPYVIEINPRVTASMVALELASGLNVGEAALNSFLGELPEQPEFTKKVRFRKGEKGLIFEVAE